MERKRITPELQAELQRLALMHDDAIDTSDIPEALDWQGATRGRFVEHPIEARSYDVRAVANWFLDKAAEASTAITNMGINKLVYLAVERFLAERRVLLTPARVEAWNHGPVFREVYQAFQSFDDRPISSRATRFSAEKRAMVTAAESFELHDQAFLEAIWQRYGHRTPSQLRAISHAPGGPWDVVWRYRGALNPGMEITPSIIFEHAPNWREVNEN